MKRSLDRYATKRSFSRTPEPPPEVAEVRHGPLLFVIQKHAARRLHYDFRLELDGVLKSWAVPKGLSLDASEKRLAVEVEDHPFEYGSFEGVIPHREYGAGAVIVWDCGVYSPDEDGESLDRTQATADARAGLEAGKLTFFLRGQKVKGAFALVRTKSGNGRQWLLIKHRDRFATAASLPEPDTSVLSGLTLDEMASGAAPERDDAMRLAPAGPAETLPRELDPMLAREGDAARLDRHWLFEPKLDGYRVLASLQGSNVRLKSRGGLDLTASFPELVRDLAQQHAGSLILDGEIVALGPDGRPSFNLLQKRAQPKTSAALAAAQRAAPAVLVCFDLLHFAGVNTRRARYIDRRRYLAQILLPTAHLQLIHASPDAEALYAAAVAAGHEGVVAKRKDSRYQPGRRSPAWVKIRAAHTTELVVGGYTQGKGEREPLGALLLGYWEDSGLKYAGHVGSGLTEAAIDALRPRLAQLRVAHSPFADKPPLHRPTTWLRPELVAQVRFIAWTPAGLLRAPVFLRLRQDVAARSIRKPTAPGAAGSAVRS
jgi:bifunctional non-homologous end joining protein LigD